VGAGPGHPELLTLKAAELLRRADVIVYDRLIQEEVLALAKPSAERIYMGKPLDRHESRQQQIHELLVRKAREGKVVVRLKGGDPFLFGRGGEEAEYLADHGIPFDVIPGVTSALSAPLAAGIAVTHRNAASSVAIVTGHEAKKDHERVDWAALARLDTLIFLMGVSNTGLIAGSLIRNGMAPDTPAAMIQMVYWPDERAVFATLGTIEEEVQRAGIKPPATLVIGRVVAMREKLAQAARELRRRPDGTSRFEPAPVPDQLLRLATAGLGSQVLGFALEIALFDHLEDFEPAARLAQKLGLDEAALAELLDALVALGVLERQAEGYRNLELASRYLRSASPHSLRRLLLYQGRLAGGWEEVARYAREGCPEFLPASDEISLQASLEELARFAAPAVAEKLDLAGRAVVLVVGWGGEVFREVFARRWPQLELLCSNPFLDGDRSEAALPPGPAGAARPGAILLSGLLASSDRGQVQQMLQTAAARLRPDGLLALIDAFLPGGALPPPEVVLGSLGRRMSRGGCRSWSVDRLRGELEALGFDSIEVYALAAGMTLVTAMRTSGRL
jgi:uroporphyrin-III C-methyltransferase